jgi:tRNA threonylcarbamoyladenosine biosynthesis protein TsaE
LSTEAKRTSKSFVTRSPEETEELGERLAEGLSAGSVVALKGELGAGKTVFAKGVARGLGVEGYLKSPSFTIVNEYSEGRVPLYHIDLYRLAEDAMEDGEDGFAIEEYLYGDGICIIEWAERAATLIPADAIRVSISYGAQSDDGVAINTKDAETTRTLVVSFNEYDEPSLGEGKK